MTKPLTPQAKTIIVFYESKLDSFMADLFTVLLFAVLFWFNYTFIGGNDLIDTFCLLVIIAKSLVYVSGRRHVMTNKQDAQKYIDSIYS